MVSITAIMGLDPTPLLLFVYYVLMILNHGGLNNCIVYRNIFFYCRVHVISHNSVAFRDMDLWMLNRLILVI